MSAACDHPVRRVTDDASAVTCGVCGAALEVSAEDLARLEDAPPEPPSVRYVAYPVDEDPAEKYA